MRKRGLKSDDVAPGPDDVAPGPEELEARARAAWPFAGRAEEFAVITSAISPSKPEDPGGQEDPDHPGNGVVVVAPAGVGKTRVLVEVRRWAHEQGLPVAQVIATEAGARTPYGAVLHLLPEGTVDPTDRATWHAAFAAALRTEDGPTVLLVDDAQHLDHGSAALILELAIEGAALPVVAVRRGHDIHDSITALWKNGLALRVDLQPFSTSELRDLISRALGGSVSTRTVARLAAVSDGNVLFARELVVGAIQAGSLRVRQGVWAWDEQVVLAPRLVEAVGARLAALTHDQREALAVVALGEPVPPHIAESIAAPTALVALEELGLIRTTGSDLGTVLRLGHPLYGEVALTELGRLSRRHLLARLADVIDTDPRLRQESLLRTASWRLEAGRRLDARDLLRAAVRANQTFDHPLAERLARAGLDVVDDPEATGTDRGDLRQWLTVELAQALMRANQHPQAHTLLADLEDAVVASPDRELRDSYLDTRFWSCGLGLGHIQELTDLLDRYAETHPGAPGSVDGLSAYLANLLLWQGHARAALELAGPLVDTDPAELSEQQLLLALETVCEALVTLGRHRQASEVGDRMRDLALTGRGRALSAAAEADLQLLWAAQLDGRYHDVLPTIRALHAQLENSPDLVTRGLASLGLGRILSKLGQLEHAHAVLLDAVADFRRVDLGSSLTWALVVLCTNAAQRGHVEDARRWRAEAQQRLGPSPNARIAADLATADVWLAVADGDTVAACAVALEAADRHPELVLARAGLIHLAVRVGERGAEPAAALREIAGQVECAYPALLADHAEALRAGDGRALEDVAERFVLRGLDLHAAEAAAHATAAHRAAGSADGVRRAGARVSGLRARFDPLTTPALTEPAATTSLSRRELDVARLAAQGLSNAAIAERLVVSVRTVESHLYQAFAKLGIERRAQLRTLLPAPLGGADQ